MKRKHRAGYRLLSNGEERDQPPRQRVEKSQASRYISGGCPAGLQATVGSIPEKTEKATPSKSPALRALLWMVEAPSLTQRRVMELCAFEVVFRS